MPILNYSFSFYKKKTFSILSLFTCLLFAFSINGSKSKNKKKELINLKENVLRKHKEVAEKVMIPIDSFIAKFVETLSSVVSTVIETNTVKKEFHNKKGKLIRTKDIKKDTRVEYKLEMDNKMWVPYGKKGDNILNKLNSYYNGSYDDYVEGKLNKVLNKEQDSGGYAHYFLAVLWATYTDPSVDGQEAFVNKLDKNVNMKALKLIHQLIRKAFAQLQKYHDAEETEEEKKKKAFKGLNQFFNTYYRPQEIEDHIIEEYIVQKQSRGNTNITINKQKISIDDQITLYTRKLQIYTDFLLSNSKSDIMQEPIISKIVSDLEVAFRVKKEKEIKKKQKYEELKKREQEKRNAKAFEDQERKLAHEQKMREAELKAQQDIAAKKFKIEENKQKALQNEFKTEQTKKDLADKALEAAETNARAGLENAVANNTKLLEDRAQQQLKEKEIKLKNDEASANDQLYEIEKKNVANKQKLAEIKKMEDESEVSKLDAQIKLENAKGEARKAYFKGALAFLSDRKTLAAAGAIFISFVLLFKAIPFLLKAIFIPKPDIIQETSLPTTYKQWFQRLLFGKKKTKSLEHLMVYNEDIQEFIKNEIGRVNKIQERNKGIKKESNKLGHDHLLFHGPPGTGKTFLAKHIGRNCGMEYVFVNTALLAQFENPSDAVAAVKKLFSYAKQFKTGVVLIFDEFDAIFTDRESATKLDKKIVNTFLSYVAKQNDPNIKIIGITNLAPTLDAAILRRFTPIPIETPNLATRITLLKKYLKVYLIEKGIDIDPKVIKELPRIAALLENKTGSHIQGLASYLQATFLTIKKGERVTMKDITAYIERAKSVDSRSEKNLSRPRPVKTR